MPGTAGNVSTHIKGHIEGVGDRRARCRDQTAMLKNDWLSLPPPLLLLSLLLWLLDFVLLICLPLLLLLLLTCSLIPRQPLLLLRLDQCIMPRN